MRILNEEDFKKLFPEPLVDWHTQNYKCWLSIQKIQDCLFVS